MMATLKRFALLGPLDGRRMLRTVWLTTLIVYGVQFLVAALALPAYVSASSTYSQGWVWLQVAGVLLIRVVEPVLWLLLIRLILEVCRRLLNATDVQLTQDTPS